MKINEIKRSKYHLKVLEKRKFKFRRSKYEKNEVERFEIDFERFRVDSGILRMPWYEVEPTWIESKLTLSEG